MTAKPIQILLVEDNEGDILLTIEAFEEGKIANIITVVKDGWEAVQYLEKTGEYSGAMTPDLVLLDINLPKMNGHEVLKRVKNNDYLKHIPIIMLTTSSLDQDIFQSYNNHVNCYITKPVEIKDFLKVVSTIEHFWISVVELPKKPISNP